MTKETDYFATFCKISNALGTTVSLDEILNLIVESSIETMGAKAACLFLADEEKDVFVPKAQKGLSENYLHARPLRAREIVHNILDGGFLAIYDATSDPRVEHHDLKKAEGIASILVVPVMVQGKTIGVLSLYSSAPREFTEDEIRFQTALAEQGGMAIERGRLFARLNRNSQLFYDLSSMINSTLDIKKILSNMTEGLAKALDVKGVTIRLLNKDTNMLELMASYGLSKEYLSKGPISPKKGVGLSMNGETVFIRNVRTDDRVQYRDSTLKEGIVSALSVPMKSGDEVIGVLKLVTGVEREFPEDTIKLVQALAHQGGLAIRNASMYLMLQEDKKSLEEDIWSHRSWF